MHGLDDFNESQYEFDVDKSKNTHFYVLSMGHRIQFLAYVPSRREVRTHK